MTEDYKLSQSAEEARFFVYKVALHLKYRPNGIFKYIKVAKYKQVIPYLSYLPET